MPYSVTVTLTLNWWVVPFVLTLMTFSYSTWILSKDPDSTFGKAVVALFLYGFATIISLIAWLVYLVMKQ